MLTKNDLQAIRGVVNDGVQIEVDQVIKKGFKELFRKELKPIYQKLNKLDKKIDLISRVPRYRHC